MLATKAQQRLVRACSTTLVVAAMTSGLAGCAPDHSELIAIEKQVDVAKSGEVLAQELVPDSLLGDDLETYGLVVGGASAGDDLRRSLRGVGFYPAVDPETNPETFWHYTSAEGDTYLAQVKDLDPGEIAALRGTDGEFFVAAASSAAIFFMR